MRLAWRNAVDSTAMRCWHGFGWAGA